MTDMVPATAADVRDQHWLDQQVAVLGDGIEAAKEIWLNWSDLRCVGRLHPGMTAGDFLASVLGGLRLDVGELVKALPDMSTREIAKVAGVSQGHPAIRGRERNLSPEPDAEPARVVGADGKSYPGRVVRTTTAEVIEPDPLPGVLVPNAVPPMRTLARSFERELQHLRSEYGDLLTDRKLAVKYGPVFAAIDNLRGSL